MTGIETVVEFHVFDRLSGPVILSHDTIEEHDVFTRHQTSLVSHLDLSGFSSLDTIRHHPRTPRILETLRTVFRGRQSTSSEPIVADNGKKPEYPHVVSVLTYCR